MLKDSQKIGLTQKQFPKTIHKKKYFICFEIAIFILGFKQFFLIFILKLSKYFGSVILNRNIQKIYTV